MSTERNPVVFAWRWTRFMVTRWLPNPDVVWLDPDTGEEAEREQWPRSEVYHGLRPMFLGWLRRLDCGCSRRLGRMVLFNAECVTHLGDLAFDFSDSADGPHNRLHAARDSEGF